MTASVGELSRDESSIEPVKIQIYESILSLAQWLDENNYRGHDKWTIANMQDKTGYFYYRRYSRWLVNKTPTLHWGQATMLCALSGLYQQLCNSEGSL